MVWVLKRRDWEMGMASKSDLNDLILRDEKGRFMSKNCPECDGTLQPIFEPFSQTIGWHCNGLFDSENTDLELQPCAYMFP